MGQSPDWVDKKAGSWSYLDLCFHIKQLEEALPPGEVRRHLTHALFMAVERGCSDAIAPLLKAGADPYAAFDARDGRSILTYAASPDDNAAADQRIQRWRALRAMLDAGADPNRADDLGRRVLDYHAEFLKRSKILLSFKDREYHILLDYGADPYARAYNGLRPVDRDQHLAGIVNGLKLRWPQMVRDMYPLTAKLLIASDGKFYPLMLRCLTAGCDVFNGNYWESPTEEIPKIAALLPPYWQSQPHVAREVLRYTSPLGKWRQHVDGAPDRTDIRL